jgi:hypothetical protein
MSLVAMEAPVSSSAEDIRDEKVKVLRCTAPIEAREVVVVSARSALSAFATHLIVPAPSARYQCLPFAVAACKTHCI